MSNDTLQMMKAGGFRKSMFEEEWRSEARCKGLDINLFFDKYEEDSQLARTVDSEICLRCPVIKQCFEYATEMQEPYKAHGVFGGVYFVDGEISKSRNSHKTKEVWEEILAAVQNNG